ncbi:MAG: hypothetical protein A2Z83_08485 [Omnitrophica bacterium GWA2_52_8]|nr:MAG: hypothetical protein A2Z83_08485 [Omnitrophica bacterium GWA2_52_8]
MALNAKKEPRILVTRADRIGDLVLSTAVFPVIRKKYPHARLGCLTFLENREIVEGNPYLDEVILYDKKGAERGFFGNLRFAWSLRKKKYDVVIHLHATNRMHFAGWLAGIPVRIGWDRRSPWALTRVYSDIKKEGKKHEAEYNFLPLESLGIECPEKLETYFPVPEKAQRSLEDLLRHFNVPQNIPIVTVNPAASDLTKMWPLGKFRELLEKMTAVYPVSVIGIGSRQDREHVRQAAGGLPRVYDLSGHLSLAMLGALLKKSRLLISNDSGPVHIAQALGVNTVSIFVRNQPGLSPERWRPLYENARVLCGQGDDMASVPSGVKALREVTVDEVMVAAGTFLQPLTREASRL